MKRLLPIATGLVAAGWLVLLLAGGAIARALGGKFAGAITRLGEGKIVSAEAFVQRRLWEGAVLVTLLLAWAWAHRLAARTGWRLLHARPLAWIGHSLLALLCLNLCAGAARQTVLFWGTCWQGPETHNFTRFNIKVILAREQAGPRAALVGSSQMRAQVDEELLNSLLGARLRATELHYPGNKAYDLFLMQPTVARAQPDYVICYLSEADFHSGSVTEALPAFLRLRDTPDLFRRGGARFIPSERIGYGVAGAALPIFRLRDVLSQRLLGPGITQLQQQNYNAALDTDLASRAGTMARSYTINEETRFQQQAFVDFVARSGKAGEHVIILAGELNPLMGQRLAPEVRREMLRFLREVAATNANITLIDNLPPQATADYEDLTHVTREAQERFTRWLAVRLEEIIAARAPAPGETLRAAPPVP